MKNGIFLGTDSDNKKQHLLLPLANRHGLIAGATGTGKTVTLQILCEGLSKACLLYTSPSPRDKRQSRMPSSA